MARTPGSNALAEFSMDWPSRPCFSDREVGFFCAVPGHSHPVALSPKQSALILTRWWVYGWDIGSHIGYIGRGLVGIRRYTCNPPKRPPAWVKHLSDVSPYRVARRLAYPMVAKHHYEIQLGNLAAYILGEVSGWSIM